jgi:hypothetical protein
MKRRISASVFFAALLALASCSSQQGGTLRQAGETQVDLNQKNYRVLKAGAVGEDDGWTLLCIFPVTSAEYAVAKANLYAGVTVEGKATGLANLTEDRSTLFFLLACESRLILSADIVEFTESDSRPPVAPVASAPAAPPSAAQPPAVPRPATPPAAASPKQTTTTYEEAKLDDADVIRLRTWHEFAQEHPGLARDLGSRPSRLTDSGYLKKHPQLDAFLNEHPDLKQAMVADPGNFVVRAR